MEIKPLTTSQRAKDAGNFAGNGAVNGPSRVWGKASAEYSATGAPVTAPGMCWHSCEARSNGKTRWHREMIIRPCRVLFTAGLFLYRPTKNKKRKDAANTANG
ncbi:MAG: hypothetical protein E7331_05955 [Clostridiales bacterium]|nr:hypothetical protein [Clostridiales bacterium]